jgi:hypothetical protein
MPDRIELGTLACAAAITNGELFLNNGRLDLLGAAAPLLTAAGVDLRQVEDGLVARRSVAPMQAMRRIQPCHRRQSQASIHAFLAEKAIPRCRAGPMARSWPGKPPESGESRFTVLGSSRQV